MQNWGRRVNKQRTGKNNWKVGAIPTWNKEEGMIFDRIL